LPILAISGVNDRQLHRIIYTLNASSFVVSTAIIVLILFVFRLISVVVGRVFSRALDSSKVKISKLLREFFVVSIHRFVMFIGVLIALSQTGIELASTIELNKQHVTHLEFIVRPWVNTSDYWSTYWAANKAILLRMDKEGVPKLIPYASLKPLPEKFRYLVFLKI